MSRPSGISLLVFTAFLFAPMAWAEETATVEELRWLRAAIEKQSKQIDTLTEQLARLRIALEKAGEVPLSTPTAAAPTVAMPTAAATPAAPAAGEFSPDAPKAEAADGKRHVVVKGETLTSIAKHYSISIAELKKANKSVDERKLQIGQSLSIPAAKSAESPEKKDENP